MKLVIGTQNPGKFKEFQLLLTSPLLEVVSPAEIGLGDVDVAETGQTFADNALLKAKAFAKASHLPAVADDSGLEIQALNMMPGVHSKRFLGDVNSHQRHLFLIDQLQGKTNRTAQFTSCLAWYDPGEDQFQVFTGVMKGSISQKPAGNEGFDYDLIFIPDGETQTLAELGLAYKNKMSARSQALSQLQAFLATQPE